MYVHNQPVIRAQPIVRASIASSAKSVAQAHNQFPRNIYLLRIIKY